MVYYGPTKSVQYQPFFKPAQRGSGLFGKASKFAKKHKIASKGLKLAGSLTGDKRLKKAGSVAKAVGYGRRRRRH